MNTNQAEHDAVGAMVAQAAAAPASQLITLEPAKYAEEVYKPFVKRLNDAIASVRNIDYDITTAKGLDVATKARRLMIDIRVDADKERKARKAPITQIGKLLESHFDEVEARILPLETLFDADIKAEEKRKEELKAAEAARQEEIRKRLVAIRELPLQAVGKSAIEIAAMAEALAADEPDESFGQLLDAATVAHAETTAKLASLHAAAVAGEAEAARIAAERAELAALREAAAERQRQADAEAARVAAEQKAEADRLAALAAEQEAAALREREQAAAKLKAEADAQAGRNRAEQAQIARARQELLDLQAAADARLAAERQAAADAQHAFDSYDEALVMNVEYERAAAEKAERDRVAAETKRQLEAQAAQIAAQRKADEQRAQQASQAERPTTAAAAIAQANALAEQARLTDLADAQPAAADTAPVGDLFDMPAAAPATPPTLRLGQINERIAPLAISAGGLLSLGFAPADTDRAAKLYHEADFVRICAAIQRHISTVRATYAA